MGAPKILTHVRGAPAVARIVGELRAAGVDDITLVSPVDVEVPPLAGVRVVRNPDPDAGRTGSLQLGLLARRDEGEDGDGDEGRARREEEGPRLSPSALPSSSSSSSPSVVVWPVDHPLASAATVRALLAAEGEWVLPTHVGRSGHPIVVRGARALDAIRRAAPATPLRAIPPTLGIVPARVAVDDAGVLANLDTPESVRGL